jgi:hypothetical protein
MHARAPTLKGDMLKGFGFFWSKQSHDFSSSSSSSKMSSSRVSLETVLQNSCVGSPA